jgi:hypothetical protein
MKVFAAINDAELIRKFYEKTNIKLNYLVSYYYLDGIAYKLIKEYRNMINELYLDSGAFSVASGKSKISVTEYLKYLALYSDNFTEYFNLDDDFYNVKNNQSNQDYLEKYLPRSVKKPIPVVHDNDDPIKELSLYYDLGHRYIAIGSTTEIPDEAMDSIKEKYSDVRIHTFGKLSFEKLKRWLPYSTDAATYADAASVGEILYFDPDEKTFHKIYMGSMDRRDDGSNHYKRFEKKDKVEEFLGTTFGYNYSDLVKKSGSEYRYIVNLFYYKQLEDYLTSLETT